MTAISQFNATASLTAKRQAEAREMWTSAAGRMLVAGAYYQHPAGWLRRVLRLDGRDVHWADRHGPGECSRTTFVHAVTGPL
jgi:hypothetical protein